MDIEAFITRWTAREGGAERANYQMFLSELCEVIGVPRPDPAGSERERNDYVFERAVRPRESEGGAAPRRIDLYKKNAFILEAKQSRLPEKAKAIPLPLPLPDQQAEERGRRSIVRGWDVMMQNARKQAESYVFLLDANHPAPPFVIVCDVGHCLELYADFSGTGRAYCQFPDRQSFRIHLEDLRRAEIRDRLRSVWTDPRTLDPTKRSVRVTRAIAARLAQVSKALEARGHDPEAVAHFLMRCIFTMFAEDVDLLPKEAFSALLEECLGAPDAFAPLLDELWAKMDEPRASCASTPRSASTCAISTATSSGTRARSPSAARRSANCARRRGTPGSRSIRQSSARCSSRRSTRRSAESSAPITRRAPTCSASSRRPSWSRSAPIGKTP